MSLSVAFQSPSWLKRLDARNPVMAGDGRQVRSFDSPYFNGIFLCPRHPAEILEQLDVETFRLERQGNQYVDLFSAAGNVHDFAWRGDRQPKLPGEVANGHRQQDARFSRSKSVFQHGSSRSHELEHASCQCLEPRIAVQRVP